MYKRHFHGLKGKWKLIENNFTGTWNRMITVILFISVAVLILLANNYTPFHYQYRIHVFSHGYYALFKEINKPSIGGSINLTSHINLNDLVSNTTGTNTLLNSSTLLTTSTAVNNGPNSVKRNKENHTGNLVTELTEVPAVNNEDQNYFDGSYYDQQVNIANKAIGMAENNSNFNIINVENEEDLQNLLKLLLKNISTTPKQRTTLKKEYDGNQNSKTNYVEGSKRKPTRNNYDDKYRPWLKKYIRQRSIQKSRKNIFFIESSCGTKKLRSSHSPEDGIVLNARQCCAIESTARMNPKYKIYLLHTCELDDTFYESSSNYVRELFNYPNFYVVKVNMYRLFNSTPLHDMWKDEAFENSSYPLEHIADAMRLLVLWIYGGTYLDLDVVTMKPLTPLKSNFAGIQDEETIANGVLNFEPSGFAHNLLTTCLENFRDNFDGDDWSNNGPIVLTNALLDFCQVSEVVQVNTSHCGSFHIYPPSVFYPVHFSDWESFLDESEGQRIMQQIENSTIVHMWNRLTREGYVAHGSSQAFSLLADKYCPKTYKEVGPNFKR